MRVILIILVDFWKCVNSDKWCYLTSCPVSFPLLYYHCCWFWNRGCSHQNGDIYQLPEKIMHHSAKIYQKNIISKEKLTKRLVNLGWNQPIHIKYSVCGKTLFLVHFIKNKMLIERTLLLLHSAHSSSTVARYWETWGMALHR